jgi:RNA polymerase sigma-70 factor (sigma-E family)
VDEDFAQFAVETAPRLMRLARVLAGNEHDAADLVQDTLVRVGTRWGRVDRRGNPAGYTMTVMVRLNVDRYRKRSWETVTDDVPEAATAPAGESHGIPDWLRKAWPGLTANQRTAIALRYLEDYDVAEIATVLRCGEATVRTHLSRGLQRLRLHVPTQDQRGS